MKPTEPQREEQSLGFLSFPLACSSSSSGAFMSKSCVMKEGERQCSCLFCVCGGVTVHVKVEVVVVVIGVTYAKKPINKTNPQTDRQTKERKHTNKHAHLGPLARRHRQRALRDAILLRPVLLVELVHVHGQPVLSLKGVGGWVRV